MSEQKPGSDTIEVATSENLDSHLPAFVTDTMALIYYLNGKLPKAAGEIYSRGEQGEVAIFVPEVVLGEFVYLAMKGRLGFKEPSLDITTLLEGLFGQGFLFPLKMNILAWRILLTLDLPEIHDRMIAACAQSRGLPIITNDPEIRGLSRLATVWD